MATEFISDYDHYTKVLSLTKSVKHTLWIGTADIKDLFIEVGKETKPFLAIVAQLISKGVDVRLIHAKEPGPVFREEFDRYPILFSQLERALCPRVAQRPSDTAAAGRNGTAKADRRPDITQATRWSSCCSGEQS